MTVARLSFFNEQKRIMRKSAVTSVVARPWLATSSTILRRLLEVTRSPHVPVHDFQQTLTLSAPFHEAQDISSPLPNQQRCSELQQLTHLYPRFITGNAERTRKARTSPGRWRRTPAALCIALFQFRSNQSLDHAERYAA